MAWQQSIVQDAAAAALSASSGKWRRLFCVEKLIANALQRTSVENVEKYQSTEDTFRKIREATVGPLRTNVITMPSVNIQIRKYTFLTAMRCM